MYIKEITDYLGSKNIYYKFVGNEKTEIKSYCSIDNLKDDSITWVRYIEDVNVKRFEERRNVLLFAELGHEAEFNFNVIYVPNVHSTFFQVVDFFFGNEDPNNISPQIESSATVLTRNIGNNLYVGHHTFIGEDVVVGNNVKIFNNVTIQGKVSIGDNCIIDSQTVIGATGFGHYIDNEGNKKTVPHLGGVLIGNNVEIGCNSCIARGCLDDTVIEDGVMIDSMCFVAHNVTIRKGSMIIAGTCIGGSTTVGENTWLGINSTISDQIVVGDNTYVGMGTLINKTMQPGKVLVGVPARVLRDNTNDLKIKHKHRRN